MDLETTQTNTAAKFPLLKQGPVTTDKKTQKKNGVKARSMLLMALLNEHLLTFNQYKDAKTLFAAIQTRLQKIDKPDLDTMSFDDLYNNFKIVEQEVKGTANSDQAIFLKKHGFMPSLAVLMKLILHSKFSMLATQNFFQSMLAIDGAGFNWSIWQMMLVPTNRLYAFSDSERYLYKDSEIHMLKRELEKTKQEKESNQLKIENFDNASKSLDKLIGSQITDKSRKGVGFVSYNVVPPPHTGLFSPPKLDLSNSGLEEFQQPEFEGYGPKTSKSVSEDISNEVRESPDAPLVEELVSNDKLEKKIVSPTKIEFVRPKQQEKPVRKPVKYAEMYRSQGPRGNQRNWNNQKSQQLGSDFVMYNKACFVCGSFDHVQANFNYHLRERMVAFDDLRDALFMIHLVFAHSRGSVSTRCKGYIGGFDLDIMH
ncbi:hypothetical protein Tco_0388835 [Tanacetum coccineum]